MDFIQESQIEIGDDVIMKSWNDKGILKEFAGQPYDLVECRITGIEPINKKGDYWIHTDKGKFHHSYFRGFNVQPKLF